MLWKVHIPDGVDLVVCKRQFPECLHFSGNLAAACGTDAKEEALNDLGQLLADFSMV
jgi:hypothetical protein